MKRKNIVSFSLIAYVTFAVIIIHYLAGFFIHDDGIFIKVFDDALMFYRYADQIIKFHTYAWNPMDVPALGTTSIFYTFFTVIARLVLPATLPHYVMMYTSYTLGIAFILFFALLIFVDYREGTTDRAKDLFLFIIVLAVGQGLLPFHLRTGMDTILMMNLMAYYLYLLHRLSMNRNRILFVLAATLAIFFYPARPDAALYAVLLPVLTLLLHSDTRTYGLFLALTTLFSALITILISKLYFGYTFPLPFYVKSEIFVIDYRENVLYLIQFLSDPTIFISLLVIMVALPRSWKKESIIPGILFSVIFHFAYLLLKTNQNMGGGGRFYMPAYPAILFAAYISLPYAADLWITRFFKVRTERFIKWRTLIISAVALLFILQSTSLSLKAAGKKQTWYKNYKEFYINLNNLYPVDDNRNNKTSVMAELLGLPAECSVAASEMGITGVSFPENRVIDMLGLNYAAFVFSKDRDIVRLLMDVEKPDLIILAQANEHLNNRILSHSFFKSNYTGITSESAHMPLGFAFRNDSPCLAHFQRMVKVTGVKTGGLIVSSGK